MSCPFPLKSKKQHPPLHGKKVGKVKKKNEESQSHYIPIKLDKYVNYNN